ncbi:hypothetical protein BSK63_14590 [Paenibacillus odorifer]|nr:hypothetical protein BSK63_14590 [Paenibacillus odorifer]OME37904.1 hypothetical protein BSK46_14345 [Paenibacillus odorifer]
MPSLLKKDSIRLLEASVSSLNLALIGLSLPLRSDTRENGALYAPEVGLIGTSAEQAINACMTQIYGFKGLLSPDKKFKSASQIFDEFLKLLKSPIGISTFIFQGIQDKALHLQNIVSKVSMFRILAKSRAGGLHAGFGPSRDVAVVLAQDVSDFLTLLAKSSRIKPYLGYIPKPHDVVKDRATLIDDLVNKVNNADTMQNQAVLVRSAFLILPESEADQPDWIEAFERVSVVPTSNDVVLLLEALGRAKPSTLIKAGGDGDALPVRVDSKNPSAFSISPQFLRREFNQINDQWYADIGNANGRLKSKILDLPPQDFILDIFGLGLENLNILEGDSKLPAQQTWPFIATSLGVAGTVFPYWFLVDRTENLNELRAFMKKAEKIGNGYLKRNVAELYEGLDSIIQQTPLKIEDSEIIGNLLELHMKIDERRSKFLDMFELNKSLESPQLLTVISALIDEKINFSQAMIQICNLNEEKLARKIYWIRTIAECCNDEEDLPGLLFVLKSADLSPVKTAIRKSLRMIDFLLYGPDVG